MTGTVVGVLRGGPSKEHEVSLRSGAAILSHLSLERFIPRDIYIDQSGIWHLGGRRVEAHKILPQIQVALLPLHGEYGESGEVQRLLERFGVPYVSPDAFNTNQARHKAIGKALATQLGIKTPVFRLYTDPNAVEDAALEVTRSFQQPVVIKPAGWGSSVGVSIVGGYAPVEQALRSLFADGAEAILVEEYIRGREATAGVVENLRGEALYALPPVEIIPPPEAGFFAAHVKYSGETREICPATFSRVVMEDLQNAAKKMHQALGQRYYSRSDFIVAPSGLYYLETNSVPAVGLTTESLLPKSLKAVGVSFADFLTHLIDLALGRTK